MRGSSRWQQFQSAAGPRLRTVTDGAQPLGLRLASSTTSATRNGLERLPPQLRQRLGVSRPDKTLRRRQTAAALAGAVVAAATAAEGARRGRELQQLADGLAQLTLDVRELGGRRARQRELERRRRRKRAAGVGVGLALAGVAAALARRRRRPETTPAPMPEPEDTPVAADAGGEQLG